MLQVEVIPNAIPTGPIGIQSNEVFSPLGIFPSPLLFFTLLMGVSMTS